MQPPNRNPYAPPVADDAPTPGASSEHEATRRAHLTAETNIKTLGVLALVGGVVNLASGVAVVAAAPLEGLIAFVIAGLAIASGLGLRKLDPRGRVLYTGLAGLVIVRGAVATYSLSGVEMGDPEATRTFLVPLFFMSLFLWVLWGTKGRVVFTDHYRDVVVPATPHVKYKTSKVTIAALLLLLLFAVFTAVSLIGG